MSGISIYWIWEPAHRRAFAMSFFSITFLSPAFNAKSCLFSFGYHRFVFGGDYQRGKYLASHAASVTSCIPRLDLFISQNPFISGHGSPEKVSGRRLIIRCKLGEGCIPGGDELVD